MSDIDLINERLKSNFGVNIYGEPNFRIVFSDKQTEVRFGEYHEFSGPIYLRTVTGFHERKKYPLVKERWILERWYPASYYNRAQILLPNTVKGDYELIYIFEDKNGTALPVVDWASQIACNLSLKGSHYSDSNESVSPHERHSEQKEIIARKLKEEEDAVANTVEFSDIQVALHEGEGVTVDKEIE